MLAEIGDDRQRFADARGLKTYADDSLPKAGRVCPMAFDQRVRDWLQPAR